MAQKEGKFAVATFFIRSELFLDNMSNKNFIEEETGAKRQTLFFGSELFFAKCQELYSSCQWKGPFPL